MLNLKSLQRRTPMDWGIRSGLMLVAAWLAYIAITQSLAMVLQATAPEAAHRFAPGNGFITAQLSTKLSATDAPTADQTRSVGVARLALLQDPTVVDAVATLGNNAQLSGNAVSSRRLFAYSQLLSRRDLRTQSWEIQDAGARGSISDTLKHYDTILRTSQDATRVLYPALASAIIDPEIQAALVKILSQEPDWTQGFIGYVWANGSDPEAASSFFQALQRVRVPVPDSATAAVINALIIKQQFGQAWAYYASVRKGADQRTSRDPKFTANLGTPAPFDWTPANDGSISASIQRGGRDSLFTFAAPASIGGQVLQQVEMLAPGDYVLKGRSENIGQTTEDTRPYWSLTCQGGRELGEVDLPNSTVANGHFGGHFSVPAGCPVQVLALNIRPSNEISGITGQIDQVLLRPAN